MMKDSEFLQWIFNRLEHVHGENPRIDYMSRLRRIIYSNAILENQTKTKTKRV